MTILIIDDHRLFRTLVAAELESKMKLTLLTAENGEEAICAVDAHPVDIVLLDIAMPVKDGYETCLELQKKYPEIKILIMSQLGQREVYSWFIHQNVAGIISKGCDVEELVLAINTVRDGHRFFSRDIQEKIFDIINDVPTLSLQVDLDEREKKIIYFLKQGFSSKEIAIKMNLKIKSIDFYREQLLRKTKTRNTVELIAFSMSRGLIQ